MEIEGISALEYVLKPAVSFTIGKLAGNCLPKAEVGL